MVETQVSDELTQDERKAVINGKTAKKEITPVRWIMIWAIGIALLFTFFWVGDHFYASLPR